MITLTSAVSENLNFYVVIYQHDHYIRNAVASDERFIRDP